MRESRILLLALCSNQKVQGGDEFKPEVPSLCNILPDRADEIRARRSSALNLILGGSIDRDSVKLNQMQFNSRLVRGPEFGGTQSKTALYLPSETRYAGSFYTSVKKNSERILSETHHHVLIVSALYGLVLPDELIQVYSCHIEDHSALAATWTKDEFLTSLLLSYMHRFTIDRVVELISQDVYRELINWSRVSQKAEVLHVFGEQYAGPTLLSSVGELAREHLLGKADKEIYDLKPGDTLFLERDKVVFTKDSFPPDGYPREQRMVQEDRGHESPEHETMESQVHPSIADGLLLDHPRDIKVTSKGHNTIFEKPIDNVSDLPTEIKSIIQEFSRCPEVLEVFLKKRSKNGHGCQAFRMKLFRPQEGTGFIHAKIEGSGALCHSQDVSIRVTKNRELVTYQVLDELISRSQQ